MKKLLLLSAAAALSISTFAQSGGRSIMLNNEMSFREPVTNAKPGMLPRMSNASNLAATSAGAKTTKTMGRLYSYFDIANQMLSGVFSGTNGLITFSPIWFDSTVRQLFSTGYGTVNYSSVATNIDPVAPEFNDSDKLNLIYYPSGVGASGLMAITDSDAYTVDTVYVTGAYILEKPTRTTPDTLIISVVPNTGYWYITADKASWLKDFTTDTVLKGFAPINADSVNRTALSDVTGYDGKTWKVVLDPVTMGVGADSSITLTNFAWAPPGGPIAFPKKSKVAVSVTFKSSDTWIKNVDSINEFNHFMPIWGYEASGGSYMTYWQDQYPTDMNGSSLMFADDSTRYVPSIMIQGSNNAPTFRYQYAAISAWLTCSTCATIGTVDVKNVVNTISGVSVYPNPANSQAVVSYKLSQASNVTLTVSNTIGQVISTQNLGAALNGKAVVNTSNLADGVYFYTLTANGERSTGRIVVAH